MGKFVIGPHMRLQEWVAEEKGYFKSEGLDYEFVASTGFTTPSVKSAAELPKNQIRGAYQSIEDGRTCDISSACHWTVNMAAAAGHGRLWAGAYSMTPRCLPRGSIKSKRAQSTGTSSGARGRRRVTAVRWQSLL